MKVSDRITSSSALIDFSRPTNSGTIMCGKTTMSRNGNTGYARVSPGMSGGRDFEVVMPEFLYCCAPRRNPRLRHGGRVPGGPRGNTVLQIPCARERILYPARSVSHKI